MNIEKLTSCIQLPYLVILLILLCVLFFFEKRYFLIGMTLICVLLFWRLFFEMSSSRYFSTFIILLFVLFGFVYKTLTIRKKRISSCTALLATLLLGYNIVKVQSADSNRYLPDINETLKRRNHYEYAFLPSKEGKRIGFDLQNIITYDSKTLDQISQEYSFWGEKLYIVSNNNTTGEYIRNDLEMQIEAQYRKGSSSSKSFYLLSKAPFVEKTSPPSGVAKTNLILNGDMENVQTEAKKNERLKKWIEEGAEFYSSSSITLPEHSTLLPTWGTFDPENFQEVFVVSDNPIDGKYSLRVRNKDVDYNTFFMNEFKSASGELSLKVRNMKDVSVFRIGRYDYNPDIQGPITPDDAFHYFIFTDHDVHNILIGVDVADCKGDRSLFYISGTNFDLLIDEIRYTPREQKAD